MMLCYYSVMKCVFTVKNRVRECRAAINLTQAQLAEAVGVTRQTIISLEKCRLNPSILLGLKIARVLDQPVGDVFFLAITDVFPEDEDPTDSTSAVSAGN